MNRILIGILAAAGGVLPLLVDSTLKGIALLLAAGTAMLALRGASAATRHLVWLFAIGGMLALPALSALLPGWRVLPRWTAIAEPQASNNKPAARAAASPVPPPEVLFNGSSAPRPSRPETSWSLKDWAPIIWAAGCSLLLLRLVAAYWLLSRATFRCAVSADRRLATMLEAARRQLNLHQPIQVLLDPRRTIPMVWGVRRAHLVLPAEAVGWSESQLRSVFLHELAHVKRRDLAAAWLTQAACAVHWFNPLVWFAARRLHMESECACDNLVLASGVRATDYADHVLHVATTLVPARGAESASLAMARPSRLEGRLLAVLNERMNRRGVSRALALLALALGLCVIIPVAMLRAADARPNKPSAKDQTETGPIEKIASPPVETVTIKIAGDGGLSLNGKATTLEDLTKELQARKINNPQTEVVLRASETVAYTNLVSVLATLKPAGVNSISLMTDKALPDEASRLRLRQAEQELNRAEDLHRQNLIGDSEYEQARNHLALRRAELAGSGAVVAQARLQQAVSELQQLLKLREQKLVSASEPDEAQRNVARLRAEAADNPLDKSRAELAYARAGLDFAQANLKRTADLANDHVVSRTAREQAEVEAAAAEANFRLAEARYQESDAAGRDTKAAPPDSKPSPRAAEVARAELDVARADLNIGRANLKQISELVNQKAAGQAQLEIAAAQLEQLKAKLQLAETVYQAQLQGTPQTAWPEKPALGRQKTERLAQILAEEIKVAEGQARLARDQQQAGTATQEACLRAELEVLALKRELSDLRGDRAQAKELIAQQLRVLRSLERDTHELRQIGKASEADELRLQREILLLQRQEAELE